MSSCLRISTLPCLRVSALVLKVSLSKSLSKPSRLTAPRLVTDLPAQPARVQNLGDNDISTGIYGAAAPRQATLTTTTSCQCSLYLELVGLPVLGQIEPQAPPGDAL